MQYGERERPGPRKRIAPGGSGRSRSPYCTVHPSDNRSRPPFRKCQCLTERLIAGNVNDQQAKTERKGGKRHEGIHRERSSRRKSTTRSTCLREQPMIIHPRIGFSVRRDVRRTEKCLMMYLKRVK